MSVSRLNNSALVGDIYAALDLLDKLEKEKSERWAHQDELEDNWEALVDAARAERDAFKARVEELEWVLETANSFAPKLKKALLTITELRDERDALKARVEKLHDIGLILKLKNQADTAEAECDALKAQVEELEVKREAEERDRERSDAAVSSELGKLYMEVDNLRAQLEEYKITQSTGKEWLESIEQLKVQLERMTADALAALSKFVCTPEEGYLKSPFLLSGDIIKLGKERDTLKSKLAEANRLLRDWSLWYQRSPQDGGAHQRICINSETLAHLAKEGEEPAKKVVRRADTPESRAFWAQAKKSEKEGEE
jgi:uncharacterized coiled-coil DUF342 family protein